MPMLTMSVDWIGPPFFFYHECHSILCVLFPILLSLLRYLSNLVSHFRITSPYFFFLLSLFRDSWFPPRHRSSFFSVRSILVAFSHFTRHISSRIKVLILDLCCLFLFVTFFLRFIFPCLVDFPYARHACMHTGTGLAYSRDLTFFFLLLLFVCCLPLQRRQLNFRCYHYA